MEGSNHSGESFELNSAYQEINFYDDSTPGNNQVPFISSVHGRQQFSSLFNGEVSEPANPNELYMNSQPLYLQEVDHQIE